MNELKEEKVSQWDFERAKKHIIVGKCLHERCQFCNLVSSGSDHKITCEFTKTMVKNQIRKLGVEISVDN